MGNNKLDGRPQPGNCVVRYRGECNGPVCEGCDKYKPLRPVSFKVSNTSEIIPILTNNVPRNHDLQEKLLIDILNELKILNNKVKGDLPENEVGKRFNKLQKDCLAILESYINDLFGHTEEEQKRTKEMYVKRMVELVYDSMENYKE